MDTALKACVSELKKRALCRRETHVTRPPGIAIDILRDHRCTYLADIPQYSFNDNLKLQLIANNMMNQCKIGAPDQLDK